MTSEKWPAGGTADSTESGAAAVPPGRNTCRGGQLPSSRYLLPSARRRVRESGGTARRREFVRRKLASGSTSDTGARLHHAAIHPRLPRASLLHPLEAGRGKPLQPPRSILEERYKKTMCFLIVPRLTGNLQTSQSRDGSAQAPPRQQHHGHRLRIRRRLTEVQTKLMEENVKG